MGCVIHRQGCRRGMLICRMRSDRARERSCQLRPTRIAAWRDVGAQAYTWLVSAWREETPVERIRVELEWSGGFTGICLRSVLDTAELSAEEGEELASLVNALEGARPRQGPPSRMPDSTRYDLTVVRGGQVRRLSFEDTTVPPEARPLLERLIRHRVEG